MKIAKGILQVSVIALLLLSVLIVLRHPHRAHYDSTGTYVFSKGNAPEDVREEILQQLHKFQDGYRQRNVSILKGDQRNSTVEYDTNSLMSRHHHPGVHHR